MPGENCPAQRIGSNLRAQQCRKVTGTHSRGGHSAACVGRVILAVALVAEEKECLVTLFVGAGNVHRAT
ncbi:MAG: hypothetical protein ACLPX1_00770, partial [Steroidobacteraceae bacterium]